MQSTGQKGTHASQPVQPSTPGASAFGGFFSSVSLSGILGLSPSMSFSLRSLKTAIAGPMHPDSMYRGARKEASGSASYHAHGDALRAPVAAPAAASRTA